MIMKEKEIRESLREIGSLIHGKTEHDDSHASSVSEMRKLALLRHIEEDARIRKCTPIFNSIYVMEGNRINGFNIRIITRSFLKEKTTWAFADRFNLIFLSIY